MFQKRLDGTVDFYLYWNNYTAGFGDPNGEFGLGLDKIHHLTSGDSNMLRVDIEDFEGNTPFAEYDMFSVMSENDTYKLNHGAYSGMTFYCAILPRAVTVLHFRLLNRHGKIHDNCLRQHVTYRPYFIELKKRDLASGCR